MNALFGRCISRSTSATPNRESVNAEDGKMLASHRTRLFLLTEIPMKNLILVLAVAALAGCGVETATTAATGAAIKKQEMAEGKKTLERAQQKVEQAMEQVQQRAEKDAEK